MQLFNPSLNASMKLGYKLYSVKFKFDVADETLSKTYKGHKVSEIQISPATNNTQAQRNTPQGAYTPTGDMLTVTLSELTNGVNPEAVSNVDENSKPLVIERDRQPVFVNNKNVPGEIRTPDLWLRRPTLYPLSYRHRTATGRIISLPEQSS